MLIISGLVAFKCELDLESVDSTESSTRGLHGQGSSIDSIKLIF